jgi:hypothetical protein
VHADNSDLGETLKAVAGVSGMSIRGDIAASRVYGVYGPGSPRQVITDLLAGSGYNFILVGLTPEGVPRELLLSPEMTKSPPGTNAGQGSESATLHSADADARTPGQLGPGAIAHVPPPPPEDPEVRAQQNMRRLQQMRDSMQRQNLPK